MSKHWIIVDLLLFSIIIAIGVSVGVQRVQYNRLTETLDRTMASAIANATEAREEANAARAEAELWSTAFSVAVCESSLMHDAHNGKARGIAQFKRKSFELLMKQTGMKGLNYNLPADQFVLMMESIRQGYGEHWTCYRKLKRAKL